MAILLKGTNIAMDHSSGCIAIQVLHDHFSGCTAIRQKQRHYYHREIKLKSERAAKRNQIKQRVEKRTVEFSAKRKKGDVTLNSYVVKTKFSGMKNVLSLQITNSTHYVTQDDKTPLLTRYMTILRTELTYLIREWRHILQNTKQDNVHWSYSHTCLLQLV